MSASSNPADDDETRHPDIIFVENDHFPVSREFLKTKMPAVYKLNVEDTEPTEHLEINLTNKHVSHWGFTKFLQLVKLIDKYITEKVWNDKRSRWMHRNNPALTTEEKELLRFCLPQYLKSVDGTRFVVGTPSQFAAFFVALENDTTGPDGTNEVRGLNLYAVDSVADFTHSYLAANFTGARIAQHVHRMNSKREGYAYARLGAILENPERFRTNDDVPELSESQPSTPERKPKRKRAESAPRKKKKRG